MHGTSIREWVAYYSGESLYARTPFTAVLVRIQPMALSLRGNVTVKNKSLAQREQISMRDGENVVFFSLDIIRGKNETSID